MSICTLWYSQYFKTLALHFSRSMRNKLQMNPDLLLQILVIQTFSKLTNEEIRLK